MLYLFFLAIGGALLTLLGVRLILLSTGSLHPSLKSHYLVLGLLAGGFGLVLLLPNARGLVADLTQRATQDAGRIEPSRVFRRLR
jgi:hypothetical protein